jgi:hypothetical protein
MELVKLNKENLAILIKKRIPELLSYPEELVLESIDKDILSRLDMFLEEKNIYMFSEDNYVETEWKDMISLHYINTTYHCLPTVIRVHLFSKAKEIKPDSNYLGFFTLRITNELSILLSYIYPNFPAFKKWKYKKSRKEKQYICTFEKHIHLEGNEFIITTFPLFVQDGMLPAAHMHL